MKKILNSNYINNKKILKILNNILNNYDLLVFLGFIVFMILLFILSKICEYVLKFFE